MVGHIVSGFYEIVCRYLITVRSLYECIRSFCCIQTHINIGILYMLHNKGSI